ncbi:hypothetical protein P2G88_06760 [Aliiglaciecola sp. CAU 1673]|uniref:hypothetical protein n=1 Tax=Aliiglaciecola sp. CAU 1673 TaxID=3032595 RepID=UPI0023D9C00D|nr:hypothetical protein [Aliiglaciecola sp. CAU 1673]MDF2177948.1 hypothetical protein [Aliiglaciecola sp. CAU 1673]
MNRHFIRKSLLAAGLLSSTLISIGVMAKEQYFGHLMFRETPYASYRGIHAMAETNNPNVAHYEFQYDDKGRVTQIAYQLGDKLIRNNQVWDSFIWFAPMVKIAYSPGKEVHTYFDANGNQIETHGKVFRAEYKLNQEGQRTALAFFDKDGKPSESEWGVHRYEWQVAGDRLIREKRFGLDGEQKTIRPDFQFHEIELEYDKDGKLAFMRNLGINGQPTNNDSGAGIDRITYDLAGNFIRWQVYDKDGNPVEGNDPMVHLGEHLYDARGNKIGLRGFDRHGKQVTFSWGVYEHAMSYDSHGNQTDHKTYNEQGELLSHLNFQYNPTGTAFAWLKSLGQNGQLQESPMLGGAAALEFSYQQNGQAERKRYDSQMQPIVAEAPR